MRRIPAMLALLLLSGVASAGDFVGQASVIDGDTLEIHGTRIRLWGIDYRKAASYAAVRIAPNTAAARWPQTTSTPSSPGARSAVFR
jgi:endonuclease YncB( thermonuclease family)